MKRRHVVQLLASMGTLAFAKATALPAAAAEPPTPGPHDASLPAERVLGIGGLFFRSQDPEALTAWYQHHLGIVPTPTAVGDPDWRTQAGVTVFAAFPQTTKYFGDPQKGWMVNFRVASLERMAAQLRAAGIAVSEPKTYPNGRFARIHDPEGNPIELWEPAGSDAAG